MALPAFMVHVPIRVCLSISLSISASHAQPYIRYIFSQEFFYEVPVPLQRPCYTLQTSHSRPLSDYLRMNNSDNLYHPDPMLQHLYFDVPSSPLSRKMTSHKPQATIQPKNNFVFNLIPSFKTYLISKCATNRLLQTKKSRYIDSGLFPK